MIWNGASDKFEDTEARDIIDKAAELVENRKILMMDEWGEWALVPRDKLHDLFMLLYEAGIISNGFTDTRYIFDEENH